MRLAYFVSCFAVVRFFASTSPAFAQNYNVLFVPGGSIGGPPVPQDPDVTKNTREEIVVAANRDLNADTYYNKAGATLDDYYHDWQICRLIARGSTDNIPGTAYVYSGSPLAAGIGGALGVAIGAGIREEAVRQANRENCLLIKGWRVIRPSTRVGARITLSKGKAREAFLSNLVGVR
jgi:hypothetical protein